MEIEPVRRCIFAIPGDLTRPTGGYAYDREILSRLPNHNIAVQHLELQGAYPFPSAADLEAAADCLSKLPETTVLMVDGLAFGTFTDKTLDQIRVPIIALVHHPLAYETGLDDATARKLHASETAALAHADHVIVTGRKTIAYLVDDFGVPPDKITMAPPGTDPRRPAPQSSGSLRLLSVGAISPRKGYRDLISALVPLKHHDWTLTIVGALNSGTSEYAALRHQIDSFGLQNRVQLTGAVNDAALRRAYETAHIYVMPSNFEGYGMALAEAVAHGLPMITTRTGAVPDIVPPGAALFIEAGKTDQLTQALDKLFQDCELRNAMARASWQGAQLLPTWDGATAIIAAAIKDFSK